MKNHWIAYAVCIAFSGQLIAFGQKTETASDPYREMVDKAFTYLSEQGQADNGSFSEHAGPGITSLVATSLLKNGYSIDDPVVRNALTYVEGFVKPTGGVHALESLYKNYETSLAILLFAEANKDGRYVETIKNADAFIKRHQWGMSAAVEDSDPRYGGFGYGKHGRPDLSNTSFTIEALRAAGNDENSEAIQRALKFVTRSQNHESPLNTMKFAAKNPDGGFYYTPVGDGESKAGRTPNGGLRSYASMTYAGLKSMLYAGVDKNDSRVKAAVEWIRGHYDLKSNPGMGSEGLFYYYHVFAKALNAMGEDEFVDRDGKTHNWRMELLEELRERQNDDGSWTNGQSDRWMEGDPNLVTAYVLLALSYCKSE